MEFVVTLLVLVFGSLALGYIVGYIHGKQVMAGLAVKHVMEIMQKLGIDEDPE